MVVKYSEVSIPIMKFCYHKLSIDKKGNEEYFDYYVVYTNKFKAKKKANTWCKKNCGRYIMRTYGCWFQTREDAEAFKLKWL